MKFSLRGLLVGSLGAVALSLSPLPVSPAHANLNQEIVLTAHRVQIVHAGGYNKDQANFNITFTNFGDPPYFDCGSYNDDNALSGIEVALSAHACPTYCFGNASCVASPVVMFPFDYDFEPFVVHIVNHSTYGTFFGLNPVNVGPGTVSARILQLPAPPNSCGAWTLNVEATGLNLSSITSNPMSIWLNDEDNSGPFCFNINDAIIGSQISNPGSFVRRHKHFK